MHIWSDEMKPKRCIQCGSENIAEGEYLWVSRLPGARKYVCPDCGCIFTGCIVENRHTTTGVPGPLSELTVQPPKS